MTLQCPHCGRAWIAANTGAQSMAMKMCTLHVNRCRAQTRQERQEERRKAIAAYEKKPPRSYRVVFPEICRLPGCPAKGMMTVDEALAHIGAYIEGGDEFGVIDEDEATDAYGVICGELADLRRQLAEALGELDICRLSLAVVPREEIADLYDAYAYATAGGSLREFDDGKAREFPKVGVWLGLLPNPVSPWEEA